MSTSLRLVPCAVSRGSRDLSIIRIVCRLAYKWSMKRSERCKRVWPSVVSQEAYNKDLLEILRNLKIKEIDYGSLRLAVKVLWLSLRFPFLCIFLGSFISVPNNPVQCLWKRKTLFNRRETRVIILIGVQVIRPLCLAFRSVVALFSFRDPNNLSFPYTRDLFISSTQRRY